MDKIDNLVKKKKELLGQMQALEKKLEKVKFDLNKVKIAYREIRLEKLPKEDSFDYRITCVCGKKYKTRKDPNSAGDDRPQCKVCTVRFEKPIVEMK